MASNLRAKPISGHVTDGAGNVIRNSQITLRSFTPTGDFVVDSVVTNDDGFFVSSPLPNGEYAIYDSGVMVSTTLHEPDPEAVPVFKSNTDNVGASSSDFETLRKAGLLNNYRVYMQLEAPSVNVVRYGNTYPIYDVTLSDNNSEEYTNLASFHSMGQDSRITTTRFDIEYYAPITETSKQYRRIRWAGVPAIRYDSGTRLVIPLDYYSLVPNMPKYTYGETSGQSNISIVEVVDGGETIKILGLSSERVNYGDVVKLEYPESVGSTTMLYWYGIVADEPGSLITLTRWRSSRVADSMDSNITSGTLNVRAYAYDGMFPGLSVINASANEYITVTENVYAQSGLTEMYVYDDGQ